MNLLGENKSNQLSELNNPFNKDKIESVIFWVYPKRSQPFTADIAFKNGNTEGKQRLEAIDFPALVKKVEDFIKELK